MATWHETLIFDVLEPSALVHVQVRQSTLFSFVIASAVLQLGDFCSRQKVTLPLRFELCSTAFGDLDTWAGKADGDRDRDGRTDGGLQGGGGFGRGEFHGENFAAKKGGEIFPPAKFSRRGIQDSS